MKSELDQAIIDGYNISQTGFETTIAYNIGNDQRMIVVQDIAQAFTTLSAMTGKTYKVNVVGLDWPVFLDAMNAGGLAIYDVGWLADFADPENFCRPYQHSLGAFPVSQGALNKTAGGDRTFPPDQEFVDAEIDDAIVETNATLRGLMYWDLQERYWNDCISFPLIQPVGRRFARDWVQGWYYNSLYPGLYAYDIYKEYVTPPQVVQLDVTHSITTIVGYPTSVSPYAVYWYKGKMWIGYNASAPSGHQSDKANVSAIFSYSIFVNRTDNNPLVGSLWVEVSLKRINGTYPTYPGYQYPNNTQFYLAAGQSQPVPLDWWEDGTYPLLFMPYDPAIGVGSLWNISGVAVPFNATNSNPDLASVNDGSVLAKQLPGDFKQTAIITILDDIVIGNVYGQTKASAGAAWGSPIKVGPTQITPTVLMSDCDLKPDLDINILDYIILGNYFGQTAP